jgi:hypothetical protein
MIRLFNLWVFIEYYIFEEYIDGANLVMAVVTWIFNWYVNDTQTIILHLYLQNSI